MKYTSNNIVLFFAIHFEYILTFSTFQNYEAQWIPRPKKISLRRSNCERMFQEHTSGKIGSVMWRYREWEIRTVVKSCEGAAPLNGYGWIIQRLVKNLQNIQIYKKYKKYKIYEIYKNTKCELCHLYK